MSYMGIHNRLRATRGSARSLTCTCGAQAQEWAYRNESPSERIDRHGRRYSTNLDDYDALCFRCHRLRDKGLITHCPKGHAYEGDNVLLDAGKRKCRTCVYARNRSRKPSPEQRARATENQRRRRAVKAASA